MATYAIGDIQGCFSSLVALLERLAFDPSRDQLWLVGDLVNRGDASVHVLRYVRALGDGAVTVLGNHDLHLLAIAQQPGNPAKNNADLRQVLDAPDRDALLDWLRHRPLMHHDSALGWTMVHAGLAPQWHIGQALALADEVESVLRSDQYPDFFTHMYGDMPDQWDDALTGWDRLRCITNCLTRLRMCHPDGRLDLNYKGPPDKAPADLQPWFTLPGRASQGHRIVFGHWAALNRIVWRKHNVWGIDTGCVWGNELTALRLDGPGGITSVARQS